MHPETTTAETSFLSSAEAKPSSSAVKRIAYSSALAGFIFGFDTVVISGANLPIKELWNTTPLFHGFFIMSMALWGTVAGALLGGWPTEKWGRKKVLIAIGILFSVSSLGTALAPDPYIFSLLRFLGGLGIGISSVAAPTYISEIASRHQRGRLVALYQFNIVLGILIAFLSNYFLQGVGGANDWRWMLGVMVVPSLLYSLLVFNIPESPRWLLHTKKDRKQAMQVLEQLGMSEAEIQQSESSSVSSKSLFDIRYKKLLSLAFFIAFFNQVSGINFILYYAPEFLERAGLAAKDSLLNSIVIGGTNLVFTFVGLYLIDRLGRRTLMLIGSIGYIVSLSLVAWCFYTQASPTVLMLFLTLFIAAHAIGQGAVIWVFLSEIFPTRVRGLGQSFGASVHWVFAALITLVTPVFLDEQDGLFKNPWPIFLFFAVMMVWQLIWVLTKMPETKGVSLEDLEQRLIK